MPEEKPVPLFDWFANQFTADSRSDFIEQIRPILGTVLKPGDRILDLCCGAGAIAFWLEEQNAQVTGIDLAPALIALARREAIQRGSKVEFIQGDVLSHSLGSTVFDLAVCFGNAILDFPHATFPLFRERVFAALKPGGRFILEYLDGLLRVNQMSNPQELIEQGSEGLIRRCFKGYDPEKSTYAMEYRRLSDNETYQYTGYVYTTPMVHFLMAPEFKLEQTIRMGDGFLEIYVKSGDPDPAIIG
jgi:SAM-dependent methyltransferase